LWFPTFASSIQGLISAKAKGDQRKAHKEKDKVRNGHEHMNKIKKDQDAALDRYML
jgi:hypothetical protein